ncbi:MaoC family dehydratase [Amycolatopsis rubida]|uniref:MaoC family dehydratase n=2 Tax=Pseudonocardiaceae TaxID=2070 RepID=A0ABX0BWN8_9PSEU|nr:MaoC family dehydratase [Amycolatopsis rubida]
MNEAMIRNWVEALDDRNPVYVDDAAAKAAGRPGVVAPPAMCSTMDHGRVPALLRDPGAAPARARWRISRTRG